MLQFFSSAVVKCLEAVKPDPRKYLFIKGAPAVKYQVVTLRETGAEGVLIGWRKPSHSGESGEVEVMFSLMTVKYKPFEVEGFFHSEATL